MNQLLRIAAYLAILAPIAASIWYVPFRLSRLMNLGRDRDDDYGYGVYTLRYCW